MKQQCVENRTHRDTTDSRRGRNDFCLFTSAGISELDAEYTLKEVFKNTSASLQNQCFGAAKLCLNLTSYEGVHGKEQVRLMTKKL